MTLVRPEGSLRQEKIPLPENTGNKVEIVRTLFQPMYYANTVGVDFRNGRVELDLRMRHLIIVNDDAVSELYFSWDGTKRAGLLFPGDVITFDDLFMEYPIIYLASALTAPVRLWGW